MNWILFFVFIANLFGISTYIAKIFFKYKFKNQRIIFYGIVLVSMYTLYVYGNVESGNELLNSILSSIILAIESFVFKINLSVIETPFTNDSFYRFNFIVGFILSGTTSISIVLDTILFKLKNQIVKTLKQSSYKHILFGVNSESLKFYENEIDSSIFWVTSKEEIQELLFKKITYMNDPLTEKTIVNKFHDRQYHFISFHTVEDENIRLLQLVLKNGKNITFHILTSHHNYKIYEQYMTAGSRIHLVNLYDVIAKDVNYEYPISKYIPRDLITNTLLQNTTIQIHLIGFGKLNQRILYNGFINNQFVRKNIEFLESNPVSYYIYDRDSEQIESEHLAYFTGVFDSKIDRTHNYQYINVNVNSANFIELVKLNSFKKDVINFFYISYGNDIDNLRTALSLSSIMKLEQIKYKIFVKSQSRHEFLPQKDIIMFGEIEHYLNKKNIVQNEIDSLAMIKAYNYAKTDKSIFEHWLTLDEFTKESNRAVVMNFPFKAGLISNDIIEENNIEQIKINLSYQEHLRWNAFHLIQGFKRMPLSQIRIIEGNIINKDLSKKLHACILSQQGLYEYQNHLKELLENNGSTPEEAILKSNIIKYDDDVVTLFLNSLESHQNNNTMEDLSK